MSWLFFSVLAISCLTSTGGETRSASACPGSARRIALPRLHARVSADADAFRCAGRRDCGRARRFHSGYVGSGQTLAYRRWRGRGGTSCAGLLAAAGRVSAGFDSAYPSPFGPLGRPRQHRGNMWGQGLHGQWLSPRHSHLPAFAAHPRTASRAAVASDFGTHDRAWPWRGADVAGAAATVSRAGRGGREREQRGGAACGRRRQHAAFGRRQLRRGGMVARAWPRAALDRAQGWPPRQSDVVQRCLLAWGGATAGGDQKRGGRAKAPASGNVRSSAEDRRPDLGNREGRHHPLRLRRKFSSVPYCESPQDGVAAMSDSDVLLFVDAIEDDEVAVLLGEKRYRFPRALLPAAAKEGAWLRLAIDSSSKVGAAIEAERARLVRSDDGGNIKL